MVIAGRSVASIFSTATSVLGSVPTTRALNSCLSDVVTRISVAPINHVVVGEDITIRADDYARTEAPLAILPRSVEMVSGMISIITEELPEKWVHLHPRGQSARKSPLKF